MENTFINTTMLQDWLQLDLDAFDEQILHFIVKYLCYFSCCSSIYRITFSLYAIFATERLNDRIFRRRLKTRKTVLDVPYMILQSMEKGFRYSRLRNKKNQQRKDVENNVPKRFPVRFERPPFEEIVHSYIWNAKSIFTNIINLLCIAILFGGLQQHGVFTAAIWILGSTLNILSNYILSAVLLLYCSTDSQWAKIKCGIVLQFLATIVFDVTFLLFGFIYLCHVISGRSLEVNVDIDE